MTGDLAGRVAFVTGGSQGIGRAIVEDLAANGAAVGVCGIEVDRVEETVAAVGVHGGQALAVPADVTNRSSVERAVGATVARFGRLDALVTSAGIRRYGDVVDTDEATWDQVMAVNLKGSSDREGCPPTPPDQRTRFGRRHLLGPGPRRPGDVAAYAASKGALEMLVRSMAVDEAVHGVRVNAVCPGSVDTPMLAHRPAALVMAPMPGSRPSSSGGVGRIRSVAWLVQTRSPLSSPSSSATGRVS